MRVALFERLSIAAIQRTGQTRHRDWRAT